MSFGHPIADFGHPNIHIFVCVMGLQWDEKELVTQFAPNVYFWTPNSEILAKALAAKICGSYYGESCSLCNEKSVWSLISASQKAKTPNKVPKFYLAITDKIFNHVKTLL